MSNIVTATFKTRLDAENALRKIEALGVNEKQISMIMTDDTRGKSFNIEEHTKADEGAVAGATAGGIIGGVLGAITTATAMVLPGLNLVVAGALMTTLAGIGAGAVAGGLVGGLIGLGIPEHEAKIYEDQIKDGAILLAVDAKDKAQKQKVENVFDNVDTYSRAA